MQKFSISILDLIHEAKEKNLKELDLSARYGKSNNDERLTCLPEVLFDLKNLEVLNLSGNRLTRLPELLFNLRNLTSLDLSGNGLTELSESISKLEKLHTLQLYRNRITELPESFFTLMNLTSLDLGGNNLSEIPVSISDLKELKSLNLMGNPLSELPESFFKLTKLTSLDLGYNGLTQLSESISNFQNLTSLNLMGNGLPELPMALFNITNLSSLDLGNNRLTKLPESVYNLQYLTTLNLFGNRLSELPESFSGLDNLVTLDLSYNKLRQLPLSLFSLKNLASIELKGNPLETPPLEIQRKGIEAIRDYVKQIQFVGTDYLFEAKLLIVGEGGAGKTTLAKKIKNPDYILEDEDITTRGIDVIQWGFLMNSGNVFRVNIWDFGGQEIYHATHQFFLTKRSLYALVADTRKEDTDFYYWMNIVELLSDNSPLLIIKNEKQDRHREINERQLRGEFTNLKETISSNLATNRGLDKILNEIQRQITVLPHVGTQLPKTWVRVRKTLEQDKRNYISLHEYLQICEKNHFTEPEYQKQLSEYLHDIGVILHFQDDPVLRQTVILNPLWGTDAVYKALDDQQVKSNQGRFTRNDLAKIWTEKQYSTKLIELLQLMMKFNLCYEIPGNPDTYIAPQLLTENKPEYKWDYSNNLQLRYRYEFMPKGIITRFIVAIHKWIYEQKYVWKSGVILNRDQTWAEVIENYNSRQITIRIAGRRRKEFMTSITDRMDEIHDSYNRLKYEKLIPCNCKVCLDRKEPHFFRFESLQRRIDEGRYLVECDESFESVNVYELVDDVMDHAEALEFISSRTYPSTRQTRHRIVSNADKEVFISYVSDSESESIINDLEQVFDRYGIAVIRDKNQLNYKDNIRDFMRRIGKGKCVLAIISKQYLESDNCMFELVEVARYGNFYDRIFPIVLKNSNIYDPLSQLDYVKHWEEKINTLDSAMKTVGSAYLIGMNEAINQYTDIRNTISELLNILKEMNTFTIDALSESSFEQIIEKVEERLSK